MKELIMPKERWRYGAMIGVGGIGSGQFFAIHGNRTLTREESRGGRILDRRDYCKLHIVSHYVRKLLGPRFVTIPVGKVGDDEVGRRLLEEIQAAGLKVHRIQISPGDQTLFSFCFFYPDGTGGNLTTDDSASSHVDPTYVLSAEEDFSRHRGAGIALAVPEVPLAARAALIRLGSNYDFLRVASFTSDEIPEVLSSGLIRDLDLMAMNQDEAATICDVSPGHISAGEVARRAAERLSIMNPGLWISITAGGQGSWSWDGRSLQHAAPVSVPVQGTAGAGDAHLAGVLVGLVAGLELAEAQRFATLMAALSVTSPHTIHPGIDRETLLDLALRSGVSLDTKARKMLGGME